MKRAIFILTALLLQAAPAATCTIFKMTQSGRTLVGSNEDWLDENAKVWFLAAKPGKHGRVLFGFENGWAQGGMNDKGLFFDGIAGEVRDWAPTPGLETFPGNLCERILEVGETVGDAADFFRQYNFPSLIVGTYVFVDASGHAAVISCGDSGLAIETYDRPTYAIGFHEERAEDLLREIPDPSAAALARVLKSCRRRNDYPTQYGAIYDPENLVVHAYPSRGAENAVVFDLEQEWGTGDHYHELTRPQDSVGCAAQVDHKTEPVWEKPAGELGEYVGTYDLGTALLTIEQSGDCLLLRSELVFDAIMVVEIVPVEADEFVARHVAIELTIHRDKSAGIDGLSLVYRGRVHNGRRAQ